MTIERYNEILNSNEFQIELRSKLDHLRDLLRSGRASVMVGSGFSKNAQMEEGVDVKDWNGLAQIFYKIAYGHEPSDKDLKLREPIELASRVTSMGRKTKRTCGWWRDDGVSARNISELNGYRRRDGGKTKRFKSLHAFILD